MEIKQGDKVRVSKDAPKIYTPDWVDEMFNLVLKVTKVEDGNAMVVFAKRTPYKTVLTAIPCKYLVKVDAEAKEPKFKVGDKVRKKKWDKDTTISYVEWHGTWQTYVYRFAEQEYGFNCHKEEDITLVSRRAKEPKFKAGDCVKISFEWGELPVGEKLVIKGLETIDRRKAYMYSIEGYGGIVIESMLDPYTEPKEQTEEDAGIRKMEAELDEFRKAELNRVLHPEKYYTYEVSVDNVAMDWQRYEADLAKEIALKVANKKMDNHPEEIGAYAVRVAKSVVENLKNKQI